MSRYLKSFFSDLRNYFQSEQNVRKKISKLEKHQESNNKPKINKNLMANTEEDFEDRFQMIMTFKDAPSITQFNSSDQLFSLKLISKEK